MERQGKILIAASAWHLVTASRCTSRESGGILLGIRHRDGVHVSRFLEVPDPQARSTGYRRLHGPASAALRAALDAQPSDSSLGYVGEWHTHPQPLGPSGVDRRQIKRISKRTTGVIALVVVARSPQISEWTPIGICAHQGRVLAATTEITTLELSEAARRHSTDECPR